MTTQIAVRLDADLIAFLDEQTRVGRAESRAAVIRSALRRLMREQAHQHDAEIYAQHGTDADLEAMVGHAVGQLPDLDA